MDKEAKGGHWKDVPSDREQVAKMLGATIPGFSPDEAKTLGTFQKAMNTINRAEALLQSGHNFPVVEVSASGETTRSTLNKRTLTKMKHKAFELYADKLYPDARLRGAANDIIATEQQAAQEKQAAKEAEIQTLNTVWEADSHNDPDSKQL